MEWSEPREVTFDELRDLVRAGDLILEVDSADGFVPVTTFYNNGPRACLSVSFVDGTSIECTPEHWIEVRQNPANSFIFARDGAHYVEAKRLTPSDCIVGRNAVLGIAAIEPADVREVFDLGIAHAGHRFFANGISAHNCPGSVASSTLATQAAGSAGIWAPWITVT